MASWSSTITFTASCKHYNWEKWANCMKNVGKWVWQGCVNTPVTVQQFLNSIKVSTVVSSNIRIKSRTNITFTQCFPSLSGKLMSIWFSKQTQFHVKEIFVQLNKRFSQILSVSLSKLVNFRNGNLQQTYLPTQASLEIYAWSEFENGPLNFTSVACHIQFQVPEGLSAWHQAVN